MSVIKKPDLSDPKLRAKLAKGMGHNYYGEPAWPNDLLYIFPVVIFGTFACVIGLSVLEPSGFGEPANPFATPLEILPEWYFFPTFNLLRVLPNKLLGVASMAAVPLGLLTVPFIENVTVSNNTKYFENSDYYYSRLTSGVDFRAKNLEAFDSLEKNSLDLYASVRSLYLQDRKRKILNLDVITETMNDDDWEEIDTQ